MRPSPQLACLRRRLLRRYLADARLCPGEVAVAIGVTPEYLAKMLSGSRPVTDAVAWRLQHRFGIPLDWLEGPALYDGPGGDLYRALWQDIRRWQHNCPGLA